MTSRPDLSSMSQQDIRFQPQYCSYAHLAALTPDACFLAGAGCQQKHQSKCHERCCQGMISQKQQRAYLLDLQMPGCREAHLQELLACLHCLQHTAPDLHTNTVSIIAMLCCQQPCRVQAVVNLVASHISPVMFQCLFGSSPLECNGQQT